MSWEGLTPPYRTIVADPPWPIFDPRSRPRMGAGGRRRRSTSIGYSLMSIDSIMALPVASLADDAAHLYLWVPASFHAGVTTAVEVAGAWGFSRVGDIIWRKPNYGMGAFPRLQHEFLIVCRRGRPGARPFARRDVGSVWDWPSPRDRSNFGAKIHSAKPPAAYDLIETASPGPYVDLFNRQQRMGWDSWGWGYEEVGA